MTMFVAPTAGDKMFLPQPTIRERIRSWLARLPLIGRRFRIVVPEFKMVTMPLMDVPLLDGRPDGALPVFRKDPQVEPPPPMPNKNGNVYDLRAVIASAGASMKDDVGDDIVIEEESQ
jgi:hypothetical protein